MHTTRTRPRRMIARLVLLLVPLIAVTSLADPAWAARGGGGPGLTSTVTTTPTPGSTSTTGTIWTPVSTTTSTPKPNPLPPPNLTKSPDGGFNVFGSVSLGPGLTTAVTSYGIVTCPARRVDGDSDWYASGASYSATLDNTNSGSQGGSGTTNGGTVGMRSGSFGFTCYYPPAPKDTTVRCSVQVNGVITQERGPGAYRTLFSQTFPSPWVSNKSSVTLCRQSLILTANSTLNQLGGYHLVVSGTTQDCTQRTYTDGRGAVIIRCGATATTTRHQYGAVYCSPATGFGYTLGPNAAIMDTYASEYTWSGCLQSKSGPTSCNVGPATSWWGHALAPNQVAQGFDDGRGRALVFSPMTLGGAFSNVHNEATMLVVDPTSHPYKANVSPNDDTQPFVVAGGASTWRPGDVTSYTVQTMMANAPGQNWMAYRLVQFDANITVNTLKIVSADFNTGNVVTSTGVATIAASGLQCTSPDFQLAILRARENN